MLPASWMASSSDFLKKFNQTNVISCSERQKLPLLFTELHGVVSKAQRTTRRLTATCSWLWTGASQVAASVGVSVEESTHLVEGSHIFVWKERLSPCGLPPFCLSPMQFGGFLKYSFWRVLSTRLQEKHHWECFYFRVCVVFSGNFL